MFLMNVIINFSLCLQCIFVYFSVYLGLPEASEVLVGRTCRHCRRLCREPTFQRETAQQRSQLCANEQQEAINAA